MKRDVQSTHDPSPWKPTSEQRRRKVLPQPSRAMHAHGPDPQASSGSPSQAPKTTIEGGNLAVPL